MTETCPDCMGPRITDHPDRLAAFAHRYPPMCSVARDEDDTFRADRTRHRKRGTTSWHRAASPGERALLAASGLPADPGEPVHTHVVWSGGVRRRTWSRRPLLSETSEVSA